MRERQAGAASRIRYAGGAVNTLDRPAPPAVAAAFPCVPGQPVVGNMLQGLRDRLGLLLGGTAHGQDVRLRFLHLDYLLLTSAESMQHVLVTHPQRYVKSVNYAGLKIVLGNGLLTSEGSFWKRQRKLMQPSFHKQRLEGFVDTMGECTSAMLERLRGVAAPFDLHRELTRLTFRIVGLTLLSQDLDGDARAVGDALTVALHWANRHVESLVRVPPWVPTPNNRRFNRAKRILDTLVLRIIEQRRSAAPDTERRRDLLDMLLEARDEDSGESMNDEQIKHELLTMVLAGHETTANALTFLFYLVAQHPEVHARMRAEVHEVLGDRAPSIADLKKLEYVTCVIEESMRLYPPAYVFERQASEDDEIAGVPVKKGTVVVFSPYVVHRSERHWHEPSRFAPERFRPAVRSQIGKHVYMPFGAGHRFCIGNNFAMMEMQIVTALLVRGGRFAVAPDYRLELDAQVTLRPKHGLPGTWQSA